MTGGDERSWPSGGDDEGSGRDGPVNSDVAEADDDRLRELYRTERAARERLEHRVRELGTALRLRHQEYLEMLDQVQQREEEAVRRALRELSRSEERFRLVVESVQDYAIYLLDDDGRVTTWNRGAKRILGYSEEEASGLALASFRPAPEDASARRDLERARREGRVQGEGWRTRADGARFWAHETITALEGPDGETVGFVAITRDLTERRESQRALERTAERLQETVEKLRERSREAEEARADAEEAERRMRFLAEGGRALSAYLEPRAVLRELARIAVPALADWVLVHLEDPDDSESEGLFAEPLRVARATDRVPEGTRRRLEEATLPGRQGDTALGRAMARGEPTLHARVTPPDLDRVLGPELGAAARELGTRSLAIVPLVLRDRVRGVVIQGTGKSRRRFEAEDLLLAEELVRRAASALDNARLYSAAVEASRAKSEFLAVMSHELRTPLNAILGYVDLLDAGVHGEMNPSQRQHLERIGRSSRHLLQLIEEILSFSRLEVGRESVQIEEVPLARLVDEVVEMMTPLVEEEGLEFRIGQPDRDTVVATDPSKLRQILLNLLMNAVKFTERGHVALEVELEAERVAFRVRDTGPGIEEEELERIFEPFQRGRDLVIGQHGGTGLGLPVSRDLARLLGGDLLVESEPGEGSTFTVVLPRSGPGDDGAG